MFIYVKCFTGKYVYYVPILVFETKSLYYKLKTHQRKLTCFSMYIRYAGRIYQSSW